MKEERQHHRLAGSRAVFFRRNACFRNGRDVLCSQPKAKSTCRGLRFIHSEAQAPCPRAYTVLEAAVVQFFWQARLVCHPRSPDCTPHPHNLSLALPHDSCHPSRLALQPSPGVLTSTCTPYPPMPNSPASPFWSHAPFYQAATHTRQGRRLSQASSAFPCLPWLLALTRHASWASSRTRSTQVLRRFVVPSSPS